MDHRARLFPGVVAADALIAMALLGAASFIAGDHDEVAALLVTVAVATLASLP